jgi:elongation factor Ts
MTAEEVQRLRTETGAGIMDCKRALTETGGDFNAAKDRLAAQGIARAEKKGDRETGAGHLEAYVHGGRIGVLLELRCETDFVARGDLFRELARGLALHISATDPASVEALMAEPYVRDESMTIEALVKSIVAKTGENIRIARFSRFAL